MVRKTSKIQRYIICKCLSLVIVLSFIVMTVIPPSYAQMVSHSAFNLPVSGALISISAGFNPVVVSGITIYPDIPIAFDFIINTGDDRLQGDTFEEESTRLIKYFMAALTVTKEEMSINISPQRAQELEDRYIHLDG